MSVPTKLTVLRSYSNIPFTTFSIRFQHILPLTTISINIRSGLELRVLAYDLHPPCSAALLSDLKNRTDEQLPRYLAVTKQSGSLPEDVMLDNGKTGK